MGTRVYLIRHGKTAWNTDRIVQGQMDSPLTKEGKRTVKKMANKLKNIKFDALYSSDLNRALDTAKYINKHHDLTITEDEMLRERNLGVLEGNNWKTIRRNYPKAGKIYHSNSIKAEIPGGGESKNQLMERVKMVMDNIAIQEEDKTVLIVSHGWFINYWVKEVLKIPIEEKGRTAYIENSSVSVFLYDKGEWFLEKFNT